MPLLSNLAFKPEWSSCSICNEFVELESTKVDDAGKPVHEECYATKVRLANYTGTSTV
jgi:hypothetical protein